MSPSGVFLLILLFFVSIPHKAAGEPVRDIGSRLEAVVDDSDTSPMDNRRGRFGIVF